MDALLGILLGRPLFACREAAAMLTVRGILFGCRLLAGGEAAARLDELLSSGHGCRRLGWRDGARRGRRDGRLVRLRVVHGSLSGSRWGPCLGPRSPGSLVRCAEDVASRRERGAAGRWPLSGLLVVHVLAVPAATGGRGLLLLRQVSDERLRREDHRRDRGGVLERRAGHLGSVDDALLEHVAVLALEGVEALTLGQCLDPLDDDLAVRAGVVGDLAEGRFERATQDAEAHRLIADELDEVERRDGLKQGHATAGDQALFNGCACGSQRTFDAVLLLLELDLCGCAH